MTRRATFLFASALLTFLISTISFGQEVQSGGGTKPEATGLGKTLALNLTIQPGGDPEGITVLTAGGHFRYSFSSSEAGKQDELSFEGQVEMRGDNQVLVVYNLVTQNIRKGEGPSERLGFDGSVLVGIGNQMTLAKSKDRTFRIKVDYAK